MLGVSGPESDKRGFVIKYSLGIIFANLILQCCRIFRLRATLELRQSAFRLFYLLLEGNSEAKIIKKQETFSHLGEIFLRMKPLHGQYRLAELNIFTKRSGENNVWSYLFLVFQRNPPYSMQIIISL